jgi:hypothetical protein
MGTSPHNIGTNYAAPTESYVGELRHGKPHGNGKVIWEFGEDYWQGLKRAPNSYDGEWRHGKMHGNGKLHLTSKEGHLFYEGEFKDNEKHGEGKLTFSGSGAVYEGDFTDGHAGGNGTLTRANGVVIHLKNWKQIFPGLSGKQAKRKRRASKNLDALIAECKQSMALNVPKMKAPRMPTLAMSSMMASEE